MAVGILVRWFPRFLMNVGHLFFAVGAVAACSRQRSSIHRIILSFLVANLRPASPTAAGISSFANQLRGGLPR